ncbi:MAG: cobalt-precorrin-5B (C(1))-methyltransferase [Methanomicrobiales archaeon]|nr:cobalt-precorrin-5B (C(1))-methyltransferase [Methanomicrobiales archaeon]
MVTDPVTGFTYPEIWVERCPTPELLGEVIRGLAVLTASGKVLRRGYSTGTTAAAASKAAVLSLQGEVQEVSLTLPCAIQVTVPVVAHGGYGSCIKFAGDHEQDVTAGVEILAHAMSTSKGVSLISGAGIGRFSRNTTRNQRGDPAISPVARESILHAIREAVDHLGLPGIEVVLTIPGGPALAERTLNPQVGILGGISILGSTGLVEPWDVHLRETVHERLASTDRPVLTTGRLGLRYARLFFPDRDVILVGSGIIEALAHAPGTPILCGLPGLILRALNPHILEGTGYQTIDEYTSSPGFYTVVQETLQTFKRKMPHVRVVLFSRDGSILGDSG